MDLSSLTHKPALDGFRVRITAEGCLTSSPPSRTGAPSAAHAADTRPQADERDHVLIAGVVGVEVVVVAEGVPHAPRHVMLGEVVA